MSADFLLELGVEEIPSKMLARAIAELPAIVGGKLTAARLEHREVKAIGTPRRLAIIVKGLALRQPDLSERVFGPPVGAAFAPDGSVSKSGIGFAQKNGVDPSTLEKAEAPGKKGLYVVANRFVAGASTRELLPALVAEIIAAIPWPKSMRWGWGETVFVRPMQWIVALLGGEVVPLTWGGLTAGRMTRGHRFLAPDAVALADAAAYVETLRHAFVIVDPGARRDMIRAELSRIEKETGCKVRPDDALLDEVTGLVEYPVAVSGGFAPALLDVPAEIIVTSMRTNQRYFAMEDASGKLAPRFVTIAGMVTRDVALVRRGNETVLAARLADAVFFVREDQKKALGDFNAKLDSVVFQAKLGDNAKTIGDKVRRIEQVVASLAHSVHCDVASAKLAAAWCKADLATGVVGEFPELQGVMGMHYARHTLRGEHAVAGVNTEIVANAIADHYLPKGPGSGLPSTIEGALIGLADRMDTLVGCFATGLEPTGSTDPFGLRRAAIGVLSILLARGAGGPQYDAAAKWNIGLHQLVGLAVAAYHGTLLVTEEHRESLFEFLRTRLRGVLVDGGLAGQDVDAALGASFDDPADARARARDLALVPQPAREVFKRIANILDDAKAKGLTTEGIVDDRLFVAPGNSEWTLHNAYAAVHGRVTACLAEKKYHELFEILVELQPAVAGFFERGEKGGVMVMDPDPALRANRLALLHQVVAPFAKVADMRLLAGASK